MCVCVCVFMCLNFSHTITFPFGLILLGKV